jgi:hypothetical protein
VCFTHPAVQGGRLSAEQVAAAVVTGGHAWISSARLSPDEPSVLRACITNHRTGPEDLKALVAEVEAAVR